jgi:hypothetical protein
MYSIEWWYLEQHTGVQLAVWKVDTSETESEQRKALALLWGNTETCIHLSILLHHVEPRVCWCPRFADTFSQFMAIVNRNSPHFISRGQFLLFKSEE